MEDQEQQISANANRFLKRVLDAKEKVRLLCDLVDEQDPNCPTEVRDAWKWYRIDKASYLAYCKDHNLTPRNV